MHGTNGVLKPGMCGAGIYKAGKSQLSYPTESLNIGMFKQVKNEVGRYDDESVYRIIDDFTFIDIGWHKNTINLSTGKLLNILQ